HTTSSCFASSASHDRRSFFFNASPPTEIYTLSLHDALPIYSAERRVRPFVGSGGYGDGEQRRDFISVEDVVKINLHFLDHPELRSEEHTSNSSHLGISYAVFCLKKKKITMLTSCHTPTPPCR